MKTKIINIPIEPLEGRYSIQWDAWIQEAFARHGFSFVTVYGRETSGRINNGSFLDVIETNLYKTEQTLRIIDILENYDDKEPLVLFYHDLWHSSLTAVGYIRAGMGFKNLKVVGCLHAGSYDKFDFLNRTGMTVWAAGVEYGWFKGIVDQIYVATNFHKNLLCEERSVLSRKVTVTGFPIFMDYLPAQQTTKENIVVFPHRLDSEKQPHLFDQLQESFRNVPEAEGWQWIKSKEVCKTKQDYFELLQRSKVAVSFAQQETWGIAMQEATLCGCVPLCPNRLSYVEMYPHEFLYSHVDFLRGKLLQYMQETPVQQLTRLQQALLIAGEAAIPNMIRQIQKL